ncbi:MAG: aminotransferase class V-fold PLP-dependent enzyme [Gemmatimonadota bacterium]
MTLPSRSAWLALPAVSLVMMSGGSREPVTSSLPNAAAESLLVTPAWVVRHHNDRNLVILDASEGAEYNQGHIEGARHVDVMAFHTHSASLPDPSSLASQFAALGLSDSSQTVIYGDPMSVSMIFLALDYLGQGAQAVVLNGGKAAWIQAGQSLVTTVAPNSAGHITPHARAEIGVTADWIMSRLGDSTFTLVDARTSAEYAGEPDHMSGNRPGHIPGARNLDWEDTIDSTGKLRSREDLQRLFGDVGYAPGHHLVLYCTVGMRASHLYLVARSLGYQPRIYVGSMNDWTSNPGSAGHGIEAALIMTSPSPQFPPNGSPGSDWARLVAGSDVEVPVLGGGTLPFINFDNAASTPPLTAVLEAVDRFAPWYSNVHRGTGFKSRLSSWAFDAARKRIGSFVGATDDRQVVLFTRNTTEGINHLARRFQFDTGDVVLVTGMEHHSNDLPWRSVAPVVHLGIDATGAVDESQLRWQLEQHRGKVAVLAVSGASNVTGRVNPVHRWARMVHEAGGMIVVDAAQLVPHRPVDVRSPDDPEHLDFLVFSGHKLYAPFGAGVVVGPGRFFSMGDPVEVGGGTVNMVSLDRVAWTSLPDREEAGTPCVIGAVALAAAMDQVCRLGWPALIRHERALTTHALESMTSIPGVEIYGQAADGDRIGVIAFNVEGMPHGLVASILSHEWGIGVRNGCFCAHPYVKTLLGITQGDAAEIEGRMSRGERTALPGTVRVSFGLYNTESEVDRLAKALGAIVRGRYDRRYREDPVTGEYLHPEWQPDFEQALRTGRL